MTSTTLSNQGNSLQQATNVYSLVMRNRENENLLMSFPNGFFSCPFVPDDVSFNPVQDSFLILDRSKPDFFIAGVGARNRDLCGKEITCVSFFKDQMDTYKYNLGTPPHFTFDTNKGIILLRFGDCVYYLRSNGWTVNAYSSKNDLKCGSVPTIGIVFGANGKPVSVARTHTLSMASPDKPLTKTTRYPYIYLDCRNDVGIHKVHQGSIEKEKKLAQLLDVTSDSLTVLAEKIDGNALKRKRDRTLQKINEIETNLKKIKKSLE